MLYSETEREQLRRFDFPVLRTNTSPRTVDFLDCWKPEMHAGTDYVRDAAKQLGPKGIVTGEERIPIYVQCGTSVDCAVFASVTVW